MLLRLLHSYPHLGMLRRSLASGRRSSPAPARVAPAPRRPSAPKSMSRLPPTADAMRRAATGCQPSSVDRGCSHSSICLAEALSRRSVTMARRWKSSRSCRRFSSHTAVAGDSLWRSSGRGDGRNILAVRLQLEGCWRIHAVSKLGDEPRCPSPLGHLQRRRKRPRFQPEQLSDDRPAVERECSAIERRQSAFRLLVRTRSIQRGRGRAEHLPGRVPHRHMMSAVLQPARIGA